MNREKRTFADDANVATKHGWKGPQCRVAGQWNGWCRPGSTQAEHVHNTHPHCTSTQMSPKNNMEQREVGGLCKYHLKSIRRDSNHVRNDLAKRQEQIRKHPYRTPQWNCISMLEFSGHGNSRRVGLNWKAQEGKHSGWGEMGNSFHKDGKTSRWGAFKVERDDRSRRFSKGLSDHDWHRKKQIGTGCLLVLLRIRGTWWCCHTRRFKPTEGSTFSSKA